MNGAQVQLSLQQHACNIGTLMLADRAVIACGMLMSYRKVHQNALYLQ